jgi:hypothetical protein
MKLLDVAYRVARQTAIRTGIYATQPWRFGGKRSDIPTDEISLTPMHRVFYEHDGATINKWRSYLSVYDKHLRHFRGTDVKILEIGVWRGGSLSMWRKYFGCDATIFGVDINPDCAGLAKGDAEVRIGSQDDPKFLRSVVDEMGGVDIVIDDGSHIARHQNASFRVLLPLVNAKGVYICEDTCTAYWPGQYEGGFRRRTSFIETAKRLIDDIHSDFHRGTIDFVNAARTISGIHFYTGIVVIEKSPQQTPMNLMLPDGS